MSKVTLNFQVVLLKPQRFTKGSLIADPFPRCKSMFIEPSMRAKIDKISSIFINFGPKILRKKTIVLPNFNPKMEKNDKG